MTSSENEADRQQQPESQFALDAWCDQGYALTGDRRFSDLKRSLETARTLPENSPQALSLYLRILHSVSNLSH